MVSLNHLTLLYRDVSSVHNTCPPFIYITKQSNCSPSFVCITDDGHRARPQWSTET